MNMRVIGIDPGLKGAIAMWDGEALTVVGVPTLKAASRGNELNYAELASMFDLLFTSADHAFIEKVGARPDQGTASMFKFGYVAGCLRMLPMAHNIPTSMPTPQQWKKEIGVGAAKDAAVARACDLFPAYSGVFFGPRGGKLDGLAEAALIALYGHRKLTREKTE